MSHVRHSQGGGGGGRDAAASPGDRQEAMQVEQMQAYKQCQFILKPRPTETMYMSAGEVRPELARKSFKRRRSLITWAFWKGSSSHLNELSLGVSRGCLFGQPLSSVCLEDTLPKPVMVSGHISDCIKTQQIKIEPSRFESINQTVFMHLQTSSICLKVSYIKLKCKNFFASSSFEK